MFWNRTIVWNAITIVLFLTCCKNGSKVLEPTSISSPVADQVKLDELDLDRLLEGEVEQWRRTVSCVNQLVLNQSLPRAVLVYRPRNPELLGRVVIGVSLSLVLDLTATNQPLAVVHSQCEALAGCLSTFCDPEVGEAIGRRLPLIYFAQDENITCYGDAVDGSARNHLRFQRTPTRCCCC